MSAHSAEKDATRLFTAAEVIEIANETSDSLGNLYRLDFIDRIRHEARDSSPVPDAEKDVRHFLVVTFAPVADSERAEYDAADDAEKRDWDRDRRSITVECAGVDQTCFGWVECMLPHNFTEDEKDEGEAIAHGVWHQRFFYGWATEGTRCGLHQFSDAWCDSADDLAEELGEGRHSIDFEWEDEYTILMHSAARVTSPEVSS